MVAPTGLLTMARDIAEIAQRCRRIVRSRALASATVALVPIPGLDIVADVALLAKMIERINDEFGLTPQQIAQLDPGTRRRVYRSIASFGASMAGKAITGVIVMGVLQAVGVRLTSARVARYIPLAGQAVSASLSFSTVRLVGERHVRDCLRVLSNAAIK